MGLAAASYPNLEVLTAETPASDPLGMEFYPGQAEGLDCRAQVLEGQAKVEQGPHPHITSDTRKTIQKGQGHWLATLRNTICFDSCRLKAHSTCRRNVS